MVISIKAMLTVEGNVQAVGYRVLVKQTARSLKIKGKVRNLDDGRVEIYCQGNKKTILEFQKRIDIKSKEPYNVFSLNVEKIDIYFEDEDGYKDPGEEFKHFEIDYGEEAKSSIEMANLERLEIGTYMMHNLGKDVRSVGEDVRAVGKNVKEVRTEVKSVGKDVRTVGNDVKAVGGDVRTVGNDVKSLGTEIKEGFKTTHQDFHELDGKYDVVSNELKSINNNISKLVDHLGRIIDEFVENKKKLNTHKGQ